MYKEIYDKENGDTKLIKSTTDDKTDEQVFEYDTKKYTDEQPPSDLYRPVYYDNKNKEWVGTDYKEWYDEYMNNRDKDNEEESDGEYKPTEQEQEISQITKLLFNSQKEIEDLQQDFADLVKQLNDKEDQI